MRHQDFVKYKAWGVVRSADTQSEGDSKLLLRKAKKFQLAAMTDEELRELARTVAHRIGGTVDLIYEGFKRSAQNH
jgi:hypothetical protein